MKSFSGNALLLACVALVGCDGNISGPAGSGQRLRDPNPGETKLEIMGIPRHDPIQLIIPSVEVTESSVEPAADVKQSVTGHYQFVGINTGIISTEVAPFGGVKHSGYGRELSAYGIKEFTNIQSVWVGPARTDGAKAAPPPRAE